mgnify:CR=1 FL=1
MLNSQKGFKYVVRLVEAVEKIAEFTQSQEIIKEVDVEVVKEVVKEVEVERLVVDEKTQQELTQLKADYAILEDRLQEAVKAQKQLCIELDKAMISVMPIKAMIPRDPSMPKPKEYPRHQKEGQKNDNT